MLGEGRKDHGPVRGEEIEQDMAYQDQDTDFEKTPKLTMLRQFDEDPAEEKGIERKEEQGVCKIPVIL